MDSTTGGTAAPQALEGRADERHQAWGRPAATHLAAALGGAVVALSVVGATVGFSPRVKVVTRQQVVRIPVPVTQPKPLPPVLGPENPYKLQAGAGPGAPVGPGMAAKPALPGRSAPSPADTALAGLPAAKRVALPPLVLSQLQKLPPLGPKMVVVPKSTPGPKSAKPDAKDVGPTGSPLAQGTALADRGKWDEAITKLKAAATANPRDPQVFTALYKAYRQKMVAAEKYEEMEQYRALARDAQDKAALLLKQQTPSQPSTPPQTPPTPGPGPG
ncbi:MAG TPA: hypothetical protein VGN26_09845 [Armatimonadota bacterium]|jgi:hypothetical protein